MKKLFTISLAVIYLAVSSGLVVEIHHCMGEIADVSLVPSAAGECSSCGMDKQSNSCCRDELKFVKLLDVYKLSHAIYLLTAPLAIVSGDYSSQPQNGSCQVVAVDSPGPAPPHALHTSLYILHCVYRI